MFLTQRSAPISDQAPGLLVWNMMQKGGNLVPPCMLNISTSWTSRPFGSVIGRLPREMTCALWTLTSALLCFLDEIWWEFWHGTGCLGGGGAQAMVSGESSNMIELDLWATFPGPMPQPEIPVTCISETSSDLQDSIKYICETCPRKQSKKNFARLEISAIHQSRSEKKVSSPSILAHPKYLHS